MQNVNIAFIGAGNMAASLIGGLIQQNYPPQSIWASNPSSEKLQLLSKRYGIHTTSDNQTAAAQADIIIFSVKPQILKNVALDLSPILQQRKPLVLSIAAGIQEKTLQQWLGKNLAIVRCMPNTPALVGCGATGLYANNQITTAQKKLVEKIMSAVGITVWLNEESLIDAVIALSGSGPAYFFLIMEILQQTAMQMGLNQQEARLLSAQTALGAARMALSSTFEFTDLRQQVTSPGGTTEAAIRVLEDKNIRRIFAQTMEAARARAQEMAKEFTK